MPPLGSKQPVSDDLRTCPKCGASVRYAEWGRYANGRLHVMCPTCDGIEAQRQAETAEAKARGYASRGNTPEYKRQQREEEAVRVGRSLSAYISQGERSKMALAAEFDRLARRVQRRSFCAFVAAAEALFRDERYRVDPEFREEQKARYREYYEGHREREIHRVATYKREHSGRNLEWTETRLEREARLSDGTATPAALNRLKAEAHECAYCGVALNSAKRVETDHMIALAFNVPGSHSLNNIVVACARCNGRKGTLSYAEWIERVEPEHRQRVASLWVDRHGKRAA